MSRQRRTYKFRLEPTPIQADELLRMAGTARLVWNWALHRCQTFYPENQQGISQSQLSNQLTGLKRREPWLYDFDAQSLQQVLANLKRAYENHFHPKMRSGFPTFKTKKNPQPSFRIPQRVVLKDGLIYVPKLGWVNVRQSQKIEGETKSATLKRTVTGQWCVTLVSEFEWLECKPKVGSERRLPPELFPAALGICLSSASCHPPRAGVVPALLAIWGPSLRGTWGFTDWGFGGARTTSNLQGIKST